MKDEELKKRFDGIDARFEVVDERFDAVDERFNGVDARFAELRDLIVHEGQRTRKHFDVVIVLTEVRGLAGKVDRLAPRGRVSRRR
jgi:hypothetical protein